MEELKFRVWFHNPENINEGEMIYSGFITFDGKEINLNGDIFDIPCEYIIVMQYTGLKDKNGKAIYEGDIVRYNDEYIGMIVWKYTGFVLELLSDKKSTIILWYDMDSKDSIEVLGNIYENPELVVLLSDDM